jgi:uncharacterized protein (UPF0335 family)
VDAKHVVLAKKLDEQVNNAMRVEVEKQLAEKKQNVFSSKISKFFSTKLPYKMDEVQK